MQTYKVDARDYFLCPESRTRLEDLPRVMFVKDWSSCINTRHHFDFIYLVPLRR